MGHIVQAHCQFGLFLIQSIYGLKLSSRRIFKTNIQSFCLQDLNFIYVYLAFW